MQAKEIFGTWATLLLPFNSDDSIDFAALKEQIDYVAGSGVQGVYSNGTAGEFYNQTEHEFDEVSELIAASCERHSLPFQIGCSHMSPLISLDRVRRAIQLRPSAIQVILPDWFPPKTDECISFLLRVQEVAGGIGLVLYNPPHAKVRLRPADYAAFSAAGVNLVGCKMPGGDADWYRQMNSCAGNLSVFIPGHHLATGISLGAHGSYSNVACINPAAAANWYSEMVGNMEAALEQQTRIQQFMDDCIVPYIRDLGYSNQSVDKFMAAVGGWTPISPRLRWPYKWISKKEIAAVRKRAKSLLPEFFTTDLKYNNEED